MKPIIASAVALLVLAVFQQSLAERVAVFGARPDFLLLGAVIIGLLSSRRGASAAGFAAGVFHGGLAGVSIGAYAISRSAAGFVTAWSKDLRYATNPLAIAVVAAVATIFGEMVWMFIALRSGIGSFLGATIGTAIYNGVLAVPLYALLKRFVAPRR